MKRILLLSLLATGPFLASAQNYMVGRSKDGIDELYIMSVTNNSTTRNSTVVDRIKPAQGRLAEFRDKAKAEAAKNVDKAGLEELGYCKRKIQFNAPAKAYRILEISYFQLGGKLIDKSVFDEEETKWLRVPAESLTEAEFKKVTGK